MRGIDAEVRSDYNCGYVLGLSSQGGLPTHPTAITSGQRGMGELEKQIRQWRSVADRVKKDSAFSAMGMNNDKKSR